MGLYVFKFHPNRFQFNARHKECSLCRLSDYPLIQTENGRDLRVSIKISLGLSTLPAENNIDFFIYLHPKNRKDIVYDQQNYR